MSPRIITFGEIVLRLKAPDFDRFFQSPMLEATFGGDMNLVTVSEVKKLFGGDASGRAQR